MKKATKCILLVLSVLVLLNGEGYCISANIKSLKVLGWVSLLGGVFCSVDGLRDITDKKLAQLPISQWASPTIPEYGYVDDVHRNNQTEGIIGLALVVEGIFLLFDKSLQTQNVSSNNLKFNIVSSPTNIGLKLSKKLF